MALGNGEVAMIARFKVICERVRQNNGVVEVLFTCRDKAQEEHFLINVIAPPGRYEESRAYLIEIQPTLLH